MLKLALCRILAIPSHESVHLILPLDMTTRAVHTYPPDCGETSYRLLFLSSCLLRQEAMGPGEHQHGSEEGTI